ncbi:thiamine pyrophosphate-binding protein [Bacteroides sp. 224]|uniref:thiamine pyrophosphate-binding protein n=1 Tax=Bacteroides sp. 224 TaxID=2302936 RepID=UPI0013D4404E|nr:thiamine pyrophosphate-binding protein [Bacteroides sp. 224]NDV64459.1 thiamine pyrophosphate-binding protein [Bacteroides sp. 224]
MIKISDYIFKYLRDAYQIDHVFLVTGGGAMHLNNSIGRTTGVKYICNHHEQASAIASEGYYRTSGKLSVTNVTTGPGGTNAITGILGQWCDSIPGLYISGQVKESTTIASCPHIKLRQLGDQEVDIVSIVKPITKYAVMITNPLEIKYHIDKAIYIALNGRPGPVWIDIPLDVQGTMIDESKLREFDVNEIKIEEDNNTLSLQIDQLVNKISKASNPVIYVGNGVRLANKVDEFISIAEQLEIPVVTAISGSDILWYDHPLYYGKPGICGDRIGNIMVQNSDLIIILGTRLSIRQISYAYDLFAPHAYKVMVDIDNAELNKPTLSIDLKINADLRNFFTILKEKLKNFTSPRFKEWREWGKECESVLPNLFTDNPSSSDYVSSYIFADELFSQLQAGDVVVTGNGTAYTSTFQAMKVKKGIRVFANQGCAAMGYDLPAAIGAAAANTSGQTILITGDGSIQMNLQELQTLKTYNLPIKIFILENQGYLAIKTTQESFFEGYYTGSDPSSGVICPDMERIAYAYDIPFIRIKQEGEDLVSSIKKVLDAKSSMICEIKMNPMQTLFPKSASFMDENGKMSSAPLDKMAPFLPDELQIKCIFPTKK